VFGSSFTVARIGGIAIEINPSWLLIVAVLAWSLSDGVFPNMYEGWSTATYWIVGTLSSVLLFVTVLVHEMAHAVVAIKRGIPVPKITLFIFGGVSHMSKQPRSAGEEFYIAAAGPATSLGIAALMGGLALVLRDVNEQVTAIVAYLALVNLVLAIFNILPGFPLDGGRVLRSIAWKKTDSFRTATRVASSVGVAFGVILMVSGVGLMLLGYVINGIWFAFIGWFLSGAARGEADNLKLETILGPLKARDIMSPEFASVPPHLSLQLIVDEFMVGQGHRAVIVAREDTVFGIVSISDIRKHPRNEWDSTPAQTVMTPRERVVTVHVDTPALEVLELIAQKQLNQVPVLEEGRMIGLVTRRELLERIKVAEQLASEGSEEAAAMRP
jgi:Zn-dependent protease/predicted transcriptional regulator